MSASSTKSRLHLNSFEIKIIALIFMTFDHFGAYQTFTTNLSINDFFRIVGRIAAPLFLFVVVESLHYTHNKVRFAMRLYIAGVTVEIFNRIFESTFDIFSIGNILPTFFYVALIVTTTECITKCKNLKTAVIPLLCLIVPFLIFPLKTSSVSSVTPHLPSVNFFLNSGINSFIFNTEYKPNGFSLNILLCLILE